MRYLIDTHTFIWWAYKPENIPQKAFGILRVASNEVFLSYASIWEMQIKGDKLDLQHPLEMLITQQTTQNKINLLPIDTKHIFQLARIPFYKDHRDPFDRMLIAQAAIENMTLISADQNIRTLNYGITVLWD